MQFEIVDGWLYYAGPVECVQAEEAGHLVDWSRAELATDDAGEPFLRQGVKLYRAPLMDGAPAPRPRGPMKLSDLAAQVRDVFDRHLGPLYFLDAKQPAPEASKALELLDLELARKTSELASALIERDQALTALARAKEQLTEFAAVPEKTAADLDELEKPYDPIAEVP